MKKSALPLVLLVLALGGVNFLLWLGRRGDALARDLAQALPQPAAPAVAEPTAGPAIAARAAPHPAAAGLIDALRGLLARRDARAREALLNFKDDAALARFKARAAAAGLTVLGELEGSRIVRVSVDNPESLRDELLQNAGDYDGLAANGIMSLPRVPAKEDRAALDHVPFGNSALAFLGASGDRADWGRGVTIAVLDSGVAGDATFGGNRLRALDLGVGTAPGQGGSDGHGTAVAALAAGSAADAPGVAPAANLLSIRVTDTNGLSDIFTVSQAIVAAVNAGAKVVNVSLGGYSTSAALTAAITYATERGALVVAAAGNDQAAELAWPAADPRVVSVGAVDRVEQQVMFSNSGSQLKLSAPGYGVQSAWLNGERAYFDGTSMSAPLVSGALAAVMSRQPALSAGDALQLLLQSASDAGSPGVDPAYGNGILNLGWAMNRNTPGYYDTAISSHYYDAVNHTMSFVVQNRSSQAVTGLRLDAANNGAPVSWNLPTLSPGEIFIAKAPADPRTLRSGGKIEYSTQLINPPGTTDRIPGNNRKSSVLSGPTD